MERRQINHNRNCGKNIQSESSASRRAFSDIYATSTSSSTTLISPSSSSSSKSSSFSMPLVSLGVLPLNDNNDDNMKRRRRISCRRTTTEMMALIILVACSASSRFTCIPNMRLVVVVEAFQTAKSSISSNHRTASRQRTYSRSASSSTDETQKFPPYDAAENMQASANDVLVNINGHSHQNGIGHNSNQDISFMNGVENDNYQIEDDDEEDDDEDDEGPASKSSSPPAVSKSPQKKRRKKKNNPAMADPAFLRKRTDNLLKVTSATIDDAMLLEGGDSPDYSSTPLGQNSKKMKVTRKTFNFLFDAWAFSGEPEAAERALTLLRRMEILGDAVDENGKSSNLQPDVRSYTKVINAIRRSEQMSAGRDAEELLDKMQHLYETGQNEKAKPNTYTYTAVVEAYSYSGAKNSPERAYELCKRMVEKYINGDPDVKPTARAFNAVIYAYGKAGQAEQAQEVLTRLENLYRETGLPEAKPTHVNYNSLISAWAQCSTNGSYGNSGQSDGYYDDGDHHTDHPAQRAEQVLERMSQLHRAGDETVQPTTVSFNAVLDAYAKGGQDGAAEKAEELLKYMGDLYESGQNKRAKPNTRSFNSVINAWAKSRDPANALKAETTLDLMTRLYEEGNNGVRPDAHSFCTVINAWARSPSQNKAERALNTYHHMKQLYEAGNRHLRPNVVAANAVMNACAFTRGDNIHGSNHAMEIANALLQELEQSSDLKPDQVTYGTFLKVCGNQMADSFMRQQLVEALFKKCCKDGQVGNLVLQQLQAMGSNELIDHLLGQTMGEDVRIEDLPQEWTCNVVEGKWRRRKNR